MNLGNGDTKGQTAAEILMGFAKHKKLLPSNEVPMKIQSPPQDQIAVKRPAVNLSQLLSGNQSKPKQQKQEKEKKSFIVTLKLPQPLEKYIVTLKSEKLKQTPKPKINPTQSSHPFFQAVNKRLQQKSESSSKQTSTALQKSLKIPKIQKSHFKVRNSEDYSLASQQLPLTLRSTPVQEYTVSALEFLLFYTNYKDLSQPSIFSPYTVTRDTDPSLGTQLLHQRYSALVDDFRYAKFFDPTYTAALSTDVVQQWCDLYHPVSHLESLQSENIANGVANWVSIAFSKLKKVNQKKRKQKLVNANKKPIKELDSFIVYSDNESQSDEDNYSAHVPSLIIEGPIGCGKSNMIHTIVKEELNGFVFEFNSSQPRARKELEFNLKQIGTTSLVKRTPEVAADKSVIVFDDVDLIDEANGDKDFWLGAQDLLTYSYRPVIFITSDLTKIPNNVVEESTVYKFEPIPKENIYAYLDMIALTRGFNFDNKILKNLAKMSLRKSLMELQLLSYHFDTPNVGLVSVTVIEEDRPISSKPKGLIDNFETKLIKMDIAYFNDKTNEMNSYYDPSDDNNEDTGEYDNPPNIDENFDLDRTACLEFYSSKYFSNGSRSKICKYASGEQYNKRHPSNMFKYLTKDKLAMDVLPVVHELAKWELARATYNYPRLFDMHPLDAFEGLS